MNSAEFLQAWLAGLNEHGVVDVDPGLAVLLRMLANVGDQSAVIMSGPGVVAYAPWIRDGMPMTAKLIIQLDPRNRGLDPVIRSQVDLDIRVAIHYQDLGGFLNDVSQHRFDLAIVDGESLDAFANLVRMVKDSGRTVVVAEARTRSALLEPHAARYFSADLGLSASVVTRKNAQHGRDRRRRRGTVVDVTGQD